MRTLLLAAAVLATATAAAAAPASVTVSIGPELQAKAQKTYGVRDVERLAAELQKTVARELTRTGAYDGARIQLELTDAMPNRPTMKQMGDRVGLSFESLSIGGADINGQAVLPDGALKPISYRWYETDIRNARGTSTWHDAEWTFDRFARHLAREQTIASR